MPITGIGPVVKRNGAFKIFIAGSGFSDGQVVKLEFDGLCRLGTIRRPGTRGAIVLMNRSCSEEELPLKEPAEPRDDDIVEITVTVGGGTPFTETGGVED